MSESGSAVPLACEPTIATATMSCRCFAQLMSSLIRCAECILSGGLRLRNHLRKHPKGRHCTQSRVLGEERNHTTEPTSVANVLVKTGEITDIRAVSVAAKKVAEMLALPAKDRAFLARELIASLDATVDTDAETRWHEVIDRRSREIEEGKVTCRPVEQVVKDIRKKLHARRQSS